MLAVCALTILSERWLEQKWIRTLSPNYINFFNFPVISSQASSTTKEVQDINEAKGVISTTLHSLNSTHLFRHKLTFNILLFHTYLSALVHYAPFYKSRTSVTWDHSTQQNNNPFICLKWQGKKNLPQWLTGVMINGLNRLE